MFKASVVALTLGVALHIAMPASAEFYHQIVISGQNKAERKQIRQLVRILTGPRTSALVDQQGSDNRASVRQKGRGNRAFVGQYGDGNAARLRQRGRNNTAAVFQFGDTSKAVLRQRGHGRNALVFVFGAGSMLDPATWGEIRH